MRFAAVAAAADVVVQREYDRLSSMVFFRFVVATVSQLSSSDGLKLLDNPWDSVFGKNILVRLHSQYLGIYYYVLLMDFVFHICCFGTGTYR